MLEAPVSLRLAWWGTAWLEGRVSSDALIDAASHDGVVVHVLTGESTATLPVRPAPAAGDGLLDLFGYLRRAGCAGVGATFPASGDPVGLGGPAAFNQAAIEAGEALTATSLTPAGGLAWTPSRVGAAVEWQTHEARRRPPDDVGTADRALRSALREVADRLAALDVARWSPELADELMALRRGVRLQAPDGVPPRCAELAARALGVAAVAQLAHEAPSAALTASEIDARDRALGELDRAARHALSAAATPEAWPPR